MSSSTATKNERERQADVLEVARELLAEGRSDALLSLVTKLVEHNEDLATQVARVTTRADAATTRAADLERQLERLLARYKKSEAVSKAQLVLFIDAITRGEAGDVPAGDDDPRPDANNRLRDASGIAEPQDDEPKTKQPRERPPRRQPAPPHLPRIPNPLLVPTAERPCPQCGTERTCIGHETTEVIDLIPAQVIVRQDTREKLACPQCDAALVRAPLGDKVVPGGKFGDALVIDLFVGKYSDGLPLHRQKERFARLALDIAVSTLCDQITWVTDLLRPLWRAAIAECIGSTVMHLDATGLPVLDHGAPGGKRIGTLWGYVGDGVAAYIYTSTGKAKAQKAGEMGPQDILALREGFTVADASNVLDASFENNPKLIPCGCNMHYPEHVVIPRWLPAIVAACDESHKISEATIGGARASIRRASHSDADTARRSRESGDRYLARWRPELVDDRRVPRLGSPMACTLLRSRHRRAASPHAHGHCDIHVDADRSPQTSSCGAGQQGCRSQ